jgi:hypothetical protein
VIHAQYLNRISDQAIGHNEGRARNYEFARSRDATRATHLGINRQQSLDDFDDAMRDAVRGGRILLGDKRAERNEVIDCEG